jgi:hypothetical protein
VPTFQIYEANLDFMRVVTLPWRDSHVHPIMLDRWRPRADVHASFHTEWRTADEIAWKENYRIWMQWLYEFWSRGGMVGLGSDAGSQQSLYGFGTIRELELLQQAGIHPLDVVRIATTRSAEIAGLGDELCGIRYGCVAERPGRRHLDDQGRAGIRRAGIARRGRVVCRHREGRRRQVTAGANDPWR